MRERAWIGKPFTHYRELNPRLFGTRSGDQPLHHLLSRTMSSVFVCVFIKTQTLVKLNFYPLYNILPYLLSPSGIAIQVTEPLFDCPSLNGILTDRLFLQNLPSIVAGHVLKPVSGELVLDMCAAPG